MTIKLEVKRQMEVMNKLKLIELTLKILIDKSIAEQLGD